jgi:hypothetical protein
MATFQLIPTPRVHKTEADLRKIVAANNVFNSKPPYREGLLTDFRVLSDGLQILYYVQEFPLTYNTLENGYQTVTAAEQYPILVLQDNLIAVRYCRAEADNIKVSSREDDISGKDLTENSR